MQITDVETGKVGPAPKKVKREWSFKLKTVFVFLILLAGGVLVAVVGNLQTMGYFSRSASKFLPRCEIVNRIYDLQKTRALYSRGSHIINHNYTDEELFWMASMEPQRTRRDLEIPKKVAFMFLVKGSIHFAPLWEKFFRGNEHLFSIYVHASPDYTPEHKKPSVFYGRYIRSLPTAWGEISICDAERRLLANALLDLSNERFVLLSESCVPVFNFKVIYDFLVGSNYSFLSVFDDPGPFGRGRYSPSMEPEVAVEQWRKGSQWFELKRKHALYVISDTKYYPKFKDFCQPACYVDEHYIPTMLGIEVGSELANRSITFVDWSRGGYHPATFGEADVTPEFLGRIRDEKHCPWNDRPDNICSLFARKFSPGALGRLVELASSVMEID